MSEILTYFRNVQGSVNSHVHRLNTNSPTTACGLTAKGRKPVAVDVTCGKCKATGTFRRGGH